MLKKVQQIFRIIVLCIVFFTTTVVGTFGVLWVKGKNEFVKELNDIGILKTEDIVKEKEDVINEENYILYQGERYKFNDQIISILCIGVDKERFSEGQTVIGQAGQADTLILLVLDRKTKQITFINISRDSMTDIEIYNVKNEYVDTRQGQICLSYAYGDGREESCIRTVNAVSRLLFGIPIHGYIAINLSAVEEMNDLVGGVELEILEDIPNTDLYQGQTVNLTGEQARAYVKWRNYKGEDAGPEANEYRMKRQRQYMESFLKKVIERGKENPFFLLEVFEQVSENIVTNINGAKLSYLAPLAISCNIDQFKMIKVPGKITEENNYACYYVDDRALYELLLKVFYEKTIEF